MEYRQLFFSFHYEKDSFRTAKVRNIGIVGGNRIFSDNAWEKLKEKSEQVIKNWIDEQLKQRSCLVLLIGEETANRKWINYEIKKAIELDKGILGIYIHKLKDSRQAQGKKGKNPFDYIYYRGVKSSNYVSCFEPKSNSSEYVYKEIENNIDRLVEEAIKNRPSKWGIK